MIVFPADYTQHFGEHLVTAYPPQGGRYRCFERIRPAQDFVTIIETILRGDLDFKVSSVGDTAKIVTAEGEYGAWVRIQGRRGNADAQRFIGAVFTEDFAAALDALAPQPELFAEMAAQSMKFLLGATLGLGPRRRLFYYTPPPGWQPLASGLVANYYPLDFPHNRTNIVVQPAVPLAAAPKEIVEERFTSAGAGLKVEESAQEPFVTASGITGSYLRLSGTRLNQDTRISREIAVFVFEQHVYAFRLETATPEHLAAAREAFRALVASFRPLPTNPERRTGQAFVRATPLELWAS